MSDGTLIKLEGGDQSFQFNLDDVKGKVADQMRAFLLNMMPASAFDQVIEVAFKKLTEPRPEEKDRYGNTKRPAGPSELEEMVLIEMRKQLAAKVAAWAEEWKNTPDCARARDEAMLALIDKAAGTYVHRVASQIVSTAFDALSSHCEAVMACSGCGRVVVRNKSCTDCGTYNC